MVHVDKKQQTKTDDNFKNEWKSACEFIICLDKLS